MHLFHAALVSFAERREIIMEIRAMEFMTVKEAAAKWGLSERRLQTICSEGMIPGVIKFGKAWAIPVDAERPVDKRIKSGKYIKS